MKAWFKSYSPLAAMLLAVLLVAGCGSGAGNTGDNISAPSNSEAAASGSQGAQAGNGASGQDAAEGSTVYPLTVENFTKSDEGAEWAAKSQVFDKAPERVVANTQGAAELLIKLGLTDKMVGVAAIYGAGDADVKAEFDTIPVISKEYASKELVVGASPDLVMGRGDLFADADWGVGNVEGLNGLGIKTFVQHTSVKGATLNSLYQDIEELGQIFDVQPKAAAYIAELQARAEALKGGASDEKTFAYVSDGGKGSIQAYSGNTDTFQADILGLLGLKNLFGELTGEISREQLVASNPDIMLLSYYAGAPDPEQTLKSFYADPALQSIKAIQNKAIYVIDFNQFWGYSYSIFDGAEQLASELATASQ